MGSGRGEQVMKAVRRGEEWLGGLDWLVGGGEDCDGLGGRWRRRMRSWVKKDVEGLGRLASRAGKNVWVFDCINGFTV